MAKPSLLIVDDEVHLTLLYEEELEDVGYDVDVANTDEEAFELLYGKTYDLVIVEPVTMRWKELNSVRSSLRRVKKTKLLFNTTSLALEQGISCVADASVTKSSDISLLKEIIGKLLEPLLLDTPHPKDRNLIHA